MTLVALAFLVLLLFCLARATRSDEGESLHEVLARGERAAETYARGVRW